MQLANSNFVLVKTRRLPDGKKPHHLCGIRTLLNRLGTPKVREFNGERCQMPHKRESEAAWWDKHDAAKHVYYERIKQLHPDRGGGHDECAELNAIWFQLKNRFTRIGIG
jgi:hypothetical protein